MYFNEVLVENQKNEPAKPRLHRYYNKETTPDKEIVISFGVLACLEELSSKGPSLDWEYPQGSIMQESQSRILSDR